MQLSDRLQAVANLLGTCECLADVGTDHGYIPIWMIQEKRIKRAIAMDINKGPLQRAEANIKSYCLENMISTRLSDGCKELKDGEADAIVIAGMGGALTIRILEDGKHALPSVKKMVLQPQSEIYLVRKYLNDQGYMITDEDMIFEDGKYYQMMLVEKQQENVIPLSEEEFFYGPKILKKNHAVMKAFLEKEETSAKEILQVLKKQNSDRAEKRICELEDQLKLIANAKSRMEQ